jgi:hypothetical protein
MIDYADAVEIWRTIQSSRHALLRDDLIGVAVRYARYRVDDLLAEPEQKASLGQDRTACHNALIASCDILARNMKQAGEDASWRDRLGSDRKVVGDFACYLHAILGISSR